MLQNSRLQTLNHLLQNELSCPKMRKLFNKSNVNDKLLQKPAFFEQDQKSLIVQRWNTFLEKYEQAGEFDENQSYYIIEFLETALLSKQLQLDDLKLLMQFLQNRMLFQIHLNGFNSHHITSLIFKHLRCFDVIRWCPEILHHFSFHNSAFHTSTPFSQENEYLKPILEWMKSDCNKTEQTQYNFLKQKKDFLIVSDRQAHVQKIKKRDKDVEEKDQIRSDATSGFQTYKDLEQTKHQLLGPKYKGPSIFEIAFDLTIPIEMKTRLFQVAKPHEAWTIAERRVIHAIWEEVHIRRKAYFLALKCVKWSPYSIEEENCISLLQHKMENALERGHMFHLWKLIDFCCCKRWTSYLEESFIHGCFVKILEHVTCLQSEKVCYQRGYHMLQYMERMVRIKPLIAHYNIVLEAAIKKKDDASVELLLNEIQNNKVEFNERTELLLCKWFLRTRQWKQLQEALRGNKKRIHELLGSFAFPLQKQDKKGFAKCMETLLLIMNQNETKHDETSIYFELLYSIYIIKQLQQAHSLLNQLEGNIQVEAYHAMIEYYLQIEDDYEKAKQLINQMTIVSHKTYDLILHYLTSEHVQVPLIEILQYVEPLLSYQHLQESENLFYNAPKRVITMESMNRLLKKCLEDEESSQKVLQWIVSQKKWLLPNAETVALCIRLKQVHLVCEFSKMMFQAKQVIIPSSKVQRFYSIQNEDWKMVVACDEDIDERIEENWETVKWNTSWKYKSKKTKATELIHFEDLLREKK